MTKPEYANRPLTPEQREAARANALKKAQAQYPKATKINVIVGDRTDANGIIPVEFEIFTEGGIPLD